MHGALLPRSNTPRMTNTVLYLRLYTSVMHCFETALLYWEWVDHISTPQHAPVNSVPATAVRCFGTSAAL
jgi:hypothetical protein